MAESTLKCLCGLPLHYGDVDKETMVRDLVQKHGPTVKVSVAGRGTYKVPRHFLALHGLRISDIDKHGFERAS